jgi:translation elongation factor EF-Tu-like GTPase
MTKDEVIELAEQCGIVADDAEVIKFANLVAQKEREELEKELLKLRTGTASVRDYIQGRWDLIGEFQDIIRGRE